MERQEDAARDGSNPACTHCRIGMRWFRSELLRDGPTPLVAHLFVCPNCKRAERLDVTFASADTPSSPTSPHPLRLVAGGKP